MAAISRQSLPLLSPPSTALRTIASRPLGVKDVFLVDVHSVLRESLVFGDFRVPGQVRMDNRLKDHK
jgi:hypothetical protein